MKVHVFPEKGHLLNQKVSLSSAEEHFRSGPVVVLKAEVALACMGIGIVLGAGIVALWQAVKG